MVNTIRRNVPSDESEERAEPADVDEKVSPPPHGDERHVSRLVLKPLGVVRRPAQERRDTDAGERYEGSSDRTIDFW